MMQSKKNRILKIIMLAMFMALSSVLKLVSFNTGFFRFSLFDLPLILAGIIGGPLVGGLIGFGADLIYSLLFSSYPYSFLMALSSVCWGIAGGVIKHTKKKLWMFAGVTLITSMMTTGINSIYLAMYQGFQGMMVGLPLRIVTMILKSPITTFLSYVLFYKVLEPFYYQRNETKQIEPKRIKMLHRKRRQILPSVSKKNVDIDGK
jgi:ECF transporter S component (folate family)